MTQTDTVGAEFEYTLHESLAVKLIDTLLAMRTRLKPDGNWIKGYSAKDDRGLQVDPAGPNATCWCLSGAVIADSEPYRVSRPVFMLLADAIDGKPGPTYRDVETARDIIIDFNDSSTQEEVISLIDKAIEMARATL